ncbi:MAG: right-handed parallel beta-helix repeat-containing protein [Methanothrix sp.]|nr:right-handed parallel beta-helix repeat-containing protein [Methanothrix sp.]
MDIEVFISYSHNDEALKKELENHLSSLKRQGLISTWYDRKIGAGEEWKGQIDSHLNSAQIILLLVSSDFMASDYCIDIEMIRALERQEFGQAHVIPIILRPVDWQDAPFGKLQALPTNAEPIISRKWGCRDEAFVDVAKGIRSVVESLNSTRDSSLNGHAVNKNIELIIVDKMHRGDYDTISDAISAAAPGSRIMVRSGMYDEGLIIDKPLEIEGDGNLGDVVIRAEGKAAISFRTAKGMISNLVLNQMGGGDFYCVDIQQGLLELNRCDITSHSRACVAIHGKAYPKLKGNRIHDAKFGGIIVYENGQGLIEDNDIFRNDLSGITIEEAGNPTVRGNRIHDCVLHGINIWKNGQGLIEKNDIFGNSISGITIEEAGNPIIYDNKIHDGDSVGIDVRKNGQGLIEENNIFGNTNPGIMIDEAGKPTVRGNRIHDGDSVGIYVKESGQGLIEKNDIFGNISGIWIDVAGNPTVRGNRIHDCRSDGILVLKNGQGLIEKNDIFGNNYSGIEILESSCPIVRGNRINRNSLYAICAHGNWAGIIENNDLRDNKYGAWFIQDNSKNAFKRSGNQE